MHLNCTLEVCDVCQELENLEQEVQAIQKILKKISQKRIALNNSRNTVHDRLITKLPVEIICQIFVLVDNFPDNHPGTLSEAYLCAPVIISSVCRRWREIALSLPKLWTNLHINIREKPDQLDIIEDWLDRSDAQPLNLTVYFKKDENQSEISEHDSICKILRIHSARWQHLNLERAPCDISYILFNKLLTMPRSDSLEMLLGGVCFSETIFLDPPFRPGRYHSRSTDSLLVPCEWDNLTHLELVNYEVDKVFGIIQVAPKLKRCILQNMRRSSSKLVAPVEHGGLEDLDVAFNNSVSLTEFFQNIFLPSLRHLKYGHLGIPHDQNYDDLKDFLVRSQLGYMSLQTFSLECHALLLPKSKDILELGGVTHLSVDMDSRAGTQLNIFRTFFLTMSNRSVFPHLQDLRIKLGNCPGILTTPRHYQVSLSDFITKHNFQLNLANDRLERGTPSHSTVDNFPLHHKNAQDLDLTNDRKPSYRPLTSISIQLEKWTKSDVAVYNAQRNSKNDPALQESWFLNQE